jgi:hypothetical protein
MMITFLRINRRTKIAAGNRHRAFSFDRTMIFGHHHCSQAQFPVAIPEIWRGDIRV